MTVFDRFVAATFVAGWIVGVIFLAWLFFSALFSIKKSGKKVTFAAVLEGMKSVNRTARSVITSESLMTDSLSPLNRIAAAFSMFFLTCFTTLFAAYGAIKIFSTDGYLAGLIAEFLASYCRSSGVCDLRIALPSLAIALIIIFDLLAFFLFTILGFYDNPSEDASEPIREQLSVLADSLDTRFDDFEQVITKRLDSIDGGKSHE